MQMVTVIQVVIETDHALWCVL